MTEAAGRASPLGWWSVQAPRARCLNLAELLHYFIMIDEARTEPCKTVPTYTTGTKEPNGSLVELLKDGEKTTLYMTITAPGAFKGYHLHQLRRGRLVCLKGKAKITVVEGTAKREFLLDAARPERLFLPTQVYIGIENIGEEEAWLLNCPDPPYDPRLANEQLEKTPEDIAVQLKGA